MPIETIDGITVSDQPSGKVPSDPVHNVGSSVRFLKMTWRNGRGSGAKLRPSDGEITCQQQHGRSR